MNIGNFIIKEDAAGHLLRVENKEDPYHMNWIEGDTLWGTVVHPETITSEVQRGFTGKDRYQETYRFKNVSEFPVFLRETDIGIYVPCNDDYVQSRECMTRRCHTHLFCGGSVSYIMMLRMNGEAPHLGLILTKGSIASYSVTRNLKERSNDRGDFIVHPKAQVLEPGQSFEIAWELFWHEGEQDFFPALKGYPDVPLVELEKSTFFLHEEISFKITISGQRDGTELKVMTREQQVPLECASTENTNVFWCRYQPEQAGEYRFTIQYGDIQTYALLYVCQELDVIAERRCRFIAEKQQYHDRGSHLDGAYLIYDKEEDALYYSHLDDHNGGRERVVMGILIAAWLREHKDVELENSLQRYIEYVYRELYDRETGVVYNDICRNPDWNRLYNYTWMAVFQLELYHLKHDPAYLRDAYRSMKAYYCLDGKEFYGICIPMTELYETLKENGMAEEAEDIKKDFIAHAEVMIRNGTDYPESEVQYEQGIVAPALGFLLQVYTLTGQERFLTEARRQIKILQLFNGHQPDYHLFENAIRHWDGYWFGKCRNYGDTFPHYWSVLTGAEYARYAELTGDKEYEKRADASMRGSLNLFFEDGSASCAMVFPKTVNGRKGYYYDPWANDQDWALYFALKCRNLLERSGSGD